ncbi:MAG: STAS domain-containing protein [Gammaproteobacteria bacterium]|nr:MAG: STAS domain-containing protein [Gammaproteobacteria bacterium]
MIFREGDSVIVQGAVTIDNVVMLTQRGIALFDDRPLTIDLDKVTEVDSTIVSMLLEWLRATQKNNQVLHVINMPGSLKSLIQLYGVTELIPLPASETALQNAS